MTREFSITYKFYLCVVLFTGLLSCNEERAVVPDIIEVPEETEEIPDDFETRLTEVDIDTTDLFMLPADTGGVFMIHDPQSIGTIFRHFVYTPGGYAADGPEYPLLIFLHGWGPWLNNDQEPPEGLLTSGGPPRLIAENNWNPSYPFIVVAPELRSLYWNWNEVHAFINHLIENYQINKRRIYLTGLSLGGGGSWYYPGKLGEESHVAAIVPISARGEASIVENLTKVPVWAFHGHFDQSVDAYSNFGSVRLVEAINKNNPVIKARLTVFANAAHNAWTRTYESQFYNDVNSDSFEVSIYDWMLQYRKPLD